MYITTGAAVPQGYDTVAQIEDVTQLDDSGNACTKNATKITVNKAYKRGTFIRAPGSDIKKGEVILSKNQQIKEAEIGLLATLGHVSNLCVYKTPKVALLSTGNELVSPYHQESIPTGKIRDSNKAMLFSMLSQTNCSVEDRGTV